MINVTKTFLPPFDEYSAILKRAWDKAWITNNGELAQELEGKLKDILGVENLLYTGNGTIVLQMALKALNITQEVITTPFSYVATTNAILWEGCKPIFVDIEPHTFCIDPTKIEAAITNNTQAILATHVYGFPCDVEAIEKIADKHGLKVIYDGAHAFGCSYKGKSLLSYGDISTCSFHATKIFHTAEGGCIVSKKASDDEILSLYRSFGHKGDEYFSIGINGKNSELHAAMGLANLPYFSANVEERGKMFVQYDEELFGGIQKPNYRHTDFTYNYAYYPVVFKSEGELLSVMNTLSKNQIFTRRYFYPSLNTLAHITGQVCKCITSEDISTRVLCLPLYNGLTPADITTITRLINSFFV